jgi:CheY-like chemotaxis protein
MPAVVDPGAAVGEMQDLMQTILSRAIELEILVDKSVPPIRVDPAELELALINIVVNARDAMQGTGKVVVRVESVGGLSAELDDRVYAAIRVTDTGRGIPVDALDKVFEPFFTTKPAGAGTGLGLSHVYGFCTQAGGTVRIESQPGRGTTVSLYLPATDAARPAAPVEEGVPQPLKGRVLLVEDNPEIARTTADLIRSFGCEVLTAASAEEAGKLLKGEGRRVQVVVSDIAMPGGLTGLDLAKQVREQWPAVSMILMTGYTAELQAAIDAGFTVLPKPVAPETLARVLAGRLPPQRTRALASVPAG